jgi:hypothetical protein
MTLEGPAPPTLVVTNTSTSLLAIGTPNRARQRGRKPGQKTFEKYSALPAQEKLTRQRSPLPPADHAIAPSAPSAPRPAPPATTAAQPPAAPAPLVALPPPARPVPPPTTAPQLRPFACLGAYARSSGAALAFVARSIIRTGQTLLRYAVEPDDGLQSFSASVLGKLRQMLLPHYGLVLQHALSPEDGFIFRSAGCIGRTDPESRSSRCNSCRASSNTVTHYASRVPNRRPWHTMTPVCDTLLIIIHMSGLKSKVYAARLEGCGGPGRA